MNRCRQVAHRGLRPPQARQSRRWSGLLVKAETASLRSVLWMRKGEK
jgi:hypothetical protein